MKSNPFNSILFLLLSLVPISLFGQSRTAGQAVVPLGYEDQDSVRFGVFNIEGAANADYNGKGRTYIDSLTQLAGVTWEDEWGSLDAAVGFTGGRKGIMAYDAGEHPNLGELIRRIKQRIYYALPERLSYFASNGFWWRYNDAAGLNPDAAGYNNTYDANDISPYSEYPQKHAYVVDTFRTRRFSASIDSLVSFGNEGRVILGMSDERLANRMLRSIKNRSFPEDLSPSGPVGPKQFSANFDFNIQTTEIDTTAALGRATNELPLLRIQVLYKQGSATGQLGWPTLPMVPYRNAANPGNPGWWAIVDTVITKAIYDSLSLSWRAQDTLENGTPAHDWRFRQIHLQLKAVPQSYKDLISTEDGSEYAQEWGQASGQSAFQGYVHPDSLCENSNSDNTALPLLEIRVLSTYRATVRVRSLDFQDTLVDKFLYRKPI